MDNRLHVINLPIFPINLLISFDLTQDQLDSELKKLELDYKFEVSTERQITDSEGNHYFMHFSELDEDDFLLEITASSTEIVYRVFNDLEIKFNKSSESIFKYLLSYIVDKVYDKWASYSSKDMFSKIMKEVSGITKNQSSEIELPIPSLDKVQRLNGETDEKSGYPTLNSKDEKDLDTILDYIKWLKENGYKSEE